MENGQNRLWFNYKFYRGSLSEWKLTLTSPREIRGDIKSINSTHEQTIETFLTFFCSFPVDFIPHLTRALDVLVEINIEEVAKWQTKDRLILLL